MTPNTKTAEEILQEGIAMYNATVNGMSEFKFNEREIKLFVAVIEAYHEQFPTQEQDTQDKIKIVLREVANGFQKASDEIVDRKSEFYHGAKSAYDAGIKYINRAIESLPSPPKQ